MRKHRRLFSSIVALICALSLTAIAQEEALPPVTPKRIVPVEPLAPATPSIDLPAEPIRDIHTLTLADAARANDYATFDSLYTLARSQRDAAEYADLHALWTYSITDPIGAFYGEEMYQRLARAYPGFAAFIDDYKIIDRNGRAFYPTAETRQFLLQYINSGAAPKLALSSPAPARGLPSQRVTVAPTPQRTRRARRVMQKATVETPAPAPAPEPANEPVVTSVPPVVVAAVTEAPVAAAEPALTAPSATLSRPAEKGVANEAIARPAEEAIQQPKPIVTAQAIDDNALTGRGLLLLIAGLIGVGVLTMMMRTPKEEAAGAPANVEPLVRTQPETKDVPPRATGSHG